MQYTANLTWTRETPDFTAKTFDRTHAIKFGSGHAMQGSSAPEFLGKKELVNPEELFVSSIASCFMLTFIYWAAVKNLPLNAYACEAIGKLGKNADGKMAMTEVMLKLKLDFTDSQSDDVIHDLCKKAHENCFISNSVKTPITFEVVK